MFIYSDLKEYNEEIDKLGITDTNAMLGILNTLDELAEINYYIFKNRDRL